MAPQQAKTVFDYKVSLGNILTILTMIAGIIVSMARYEAKIDYSSEQIKSLSEQKVILEQRVAMLEKTMDTKTGNDSNMQKDLNRTIEYLQLLLEEKGIKYVK
jgi:hypothetical protein